MFTGCGTALVTPFRRDLSLDEETLRKLVRRQVEAGIEAQTRQEFAQGREAAGPERLVTGTAKAPGRQRQPASQAVESDLPHEAG